MSYISLDNPEFPEISEDFTRIVLEFYLNRTSILLEIYLTYLNFPFLLVPFGRVPYRFFQTEEKFAYQYRVPPKVLMGEEITGKNDFAYFQEITWTSGAENICKNALQPVLVRRFNFPEKVQQDI